MAAAIKSWDADIVNLVEVEDCIVLRELAVQVNRGASSGAGVTGYLVQGTDGFTGQDVALLTRCDDLIR